MDNHHANPYLIREIQHLQATNDNLQQQKLKDQNENENENLLRESEFKLRSELAASTEKNKKLEEQIKDLQELNSELWGENNRGKTMVKELKSEIEGLLKEKSQWAMGGEKSEKGDLEMENERYGHLIEVLNEEVENLRGENQRGMLVNRELEGEVQHLKGEVQGLKEEKKNGEGKVGEEDSGKVGRVEGMEDKADGVSAKVALSKTPPPSSPYHKISATKVAHPSKAPTSNPPTPKTPPRKRPGTKFVPSKPPVTQTQTPTTKPQTASITKRQLNNENDNKNDTESGRATKRQRNSDNDSTNSTDSDRAIKRQRGDAKKTMNERVKGRRSTETQRESVEEIRKESVRPKRPRKSAREAGGEEGWRRRQIAREEAFGKGKEVYGRRW